MHIEVKCTPILFMWFDYVMNQLTKMIFDIPMGNGVGVDIQLEYTVEGVPILLPIGVPRTNPFFLLL